MLFRLPSEEELTDHKLNEFIAKHDAECAFRFKYLKDAYETDYQIFHQKPKPDYKPDNRIAVNFAKYMVDTFNGFFIGNPIKISVDDASDHIKNYVEFLDQYNDQDDNNAELSKICVIIILIVILIRMIITQSCRRSVVSMVKDMRCIMWMNWGTSGLPT